jgi:hypothetical protein
VSQDALDKVANTIKRATDNARDAIREGQHRAAAEAERARRKGLGDELTPGEKAKSVVRESKERTQAEIDAAKQKVRKHG